MRRNARAAKTYLFLYGEYGIHIMFAHACVKAFGNYRAAKPVIERAAGNTPAQLRKACRIYRNIAYFNLLFGLVAR